MELDDVKTLLKQQLEAGGSLPMTDTFSGLASSRTQSVIGRIKRNIWLECGAMLVCMAVAAWTWHAYPLLVAHFFCVATWLFSMVFSVYLLLLYRKILFYENRPAVSIKENIEKIIAIVTRFTRLYMGISMGLLPVIFVFGLIAGYLEVSGKGLLHAFSWSKGLLLYLSAYICWSVLIYFFARWYIRKLYGDYLVHLQEQLKDVENG